MLWELSVSELRYRAVLEVQAGVSVTEVAGRYGVSRQSGHTWLRRYGAEGPSGLVDRSHRPRGHPGRVDPVVEAAICELRRQHRRWGPRRLVFELDRRGVGVLSRSTVYRSLVRNGLIEPTSRRRRRDQYRRWERATAMELWQMDVTASVFLVGGTELKVVTGIDDHSRFCVIATVVARATARPVCGAFIAAMGTYGVPTEVLTDNGKVFTGRYQKPVPVEVLFDRICRENGITHRLTKVRSPTTTGKIERLHQTLQQELLEPHGPFETIEAAQAAIDTWRHLYNSDRPHQSLNMAFPTARFANVDPQLDLRVPALLAAVPSPSPGPDPISEPDRPAVTEAVNETGGVGEAPVAWNAAVAVEADRVVPASGNLFIGGQQVWLGPGLAGRKVTIWVDDTSLHVLLDGTRLKTLPSRLGVGDLARLANHGARPAGPSPLTAGDDDSIEVDRTVNAVGIITLAGIVITVGSPLAGQRVTIRMHAALMTVIAAGTVTKTLPCPIPPGARARLRGARRAGPPAPFAPVVAQRRVSSRGSIMIATQKIHVGMIHAHKTVTVTIETDRFRLTIDEELVGVVARTTTKEVNRYKISAVQKTSRERKASTDAKTSSVK
jgi:transposase InsO family protein